SYIRRLVVQEKTPFYTLLHTNGQLPTSSFFHYIFWDETQDLSSEEKKQVLGHEYTHIRQGHSWDLLLLEIIQVVFWFHPLIYLIRQEIVNVHEFHADHVATSYTPKSTYAQLILREVMGLRIPLTHSFFESPAVLRIRMLDRMPNMGRALGKYLPGIPLIALLVLIYRVTPEAVTLSGNRLDIGTSEVQILPFSESDAEEILGTKDYKNFRELRRQAIAVQLRLDSIEQIPTPWSQEVQKSRLLQELTLIQIQIQRLEQKLKQGKFGENDSQLFPRTQEENDDQESHAYGVYKSPDAKKGKLAEASAEPDVNAFIVVEKEPQLLNIREVKKAIGYPQVARKAGIEGNVIARVLVNKEGKYVRHVMLNGVHPVLERSVGAQLPELMFSPAIQNGEPVMFWVNIPFAFKLIQ
ncbi:MAG: M56 family metallopeptidase, partial [Bacteroidota bacterium]